MKYINAKQLLLSLSISGTLLVGCGGEVSFDPSIADEPEIQLGPTESQSGNTELIFAAVPPEVSQSEQPEALHADCVKFDKSSLNFGSVASGAYYSEVVTLSNLCSVDANILELNLVSDESSRFTFEGPKKQFVLPARREVTLEIGLNAYLGISGVIATNTRVVDPIILQNSYSGTFSVVFADVTPHHWPVEVYSSSISLKGNADINTVEPNTPSTLDPRLQQDLQLGDERGLEPGTRFNERFE